MEPDHLLYLQIISMSLNLLGINQRGSVSVCVCDLTSLKLTFRYFTVLYRNAICIPSVLWCHAMIHTCVIQIIIRCMYVSLRLFVISVP